MRRARSGAGWSAAGWSAWRTGVAGLVVAVMATAVAVVVPSASEAGATTTGVTCVGKGFSTVTSATLQQGQALCNTTTGSGTTFAVVMQPDGNLVEYKSSVGSESGPAIWSTQTSNTTDTAQFTGGDLQVVSSSGDAIWSSGAGPTMVFGAPQVDSLNLVNDGNLQATNKDGTVFWQNGTLADAVVTQLTDGQSIMSPGGDYRLTMQTDGNLVLIFDPSGEDVAVWSTGTQGNPGDHASLQLDGNLVVYSSSGQALFSAGSSAPDPTLAVQDDGNVVVYGTNAAGQYDAWATNTVGDRGPTLGTGQTLQPGQFLESANGQYRLQVSQAGIVALYSTQPYDCPLWTAPSIQSGDGYQTTPQSGSYLQMSTVGDLDLFAPGTTANPLWAASSTKTWTGSGSATGDYLTLGTDGNAVLYTPGGASYRWDSNTNSVRGSVLCTGTRLTPGQYLVPWSQGTTDEGSVAAPQYTSTLSMQATCNLVLEQTSKGFTPKVIWASGTDEGVASNGVGVGGVPGNDYTGCYATMQATGNLVIYAPGYPGGQKGLWASNTVQTKSPPFNLGAIGPYLTTGVVLGTHPGVYVSTVHGTTLGDPSPSSKKTVLSILSDVLDAIALVLTFVGGPIGDVISVVGDIATYASLADGAASVAVSATAGAKSNAVAGSAPASTSSATSPPTFDDLGDSLTAKRTSKCYDPDYTGCAILPGQYLESSNGKYTFVMQATGDAQLLSGTHVMWDTKTTTTKGVGSCSDCAAFQVTMYGRVAVVTTTPKHKVLWSSDPYELLSATDPFLILQNDGNLVLYSQGGAGTAVWQTATGSLSTFSDDLGSSMTPTGCANAAGWGGCLLQGGQYLESPNDLYALDMQTDGNLVVYNRKGPIWSAGTTGNPGAFLRLQTDGTMVVMNAANTQILWQPSPGTTGTVNATLTMQGDGNLVLYGTNGKGGVSAVWQTGTQSMYGTAGNYTVLTTCASTSPSRLSPGTVLAPGACLLSPNGQYKLIMQTDGNLVLYYQAQSQYDPIWAAYPKGPPAAAAGGDAALFTGEFEGSFCVGRLTGAWCNHTTAPNAYLVLENSGNLAEYADNGPASAANVPYVAWQTGTADLRGSTLPSGTNLTPGQHLQSPTGTYTLSMGTTGLLELSYVTTASYFCPMWSEPEAKATLDRLEGTTTGLSGETYSPPLGTGSYLAMQATGNLVLVSPGTKGPINISHTTGNPGAYLQLGGDGNLVVYSSAGKALWSTNSNRDRGSTLCSSATLGVTQFLTAVGHPDQSTQDILEMKADCNLVYIGEGGNIAPWTSGTEQGYGPNGAWAGQTPSSPYYGCYATMQTDGNLVIYAPNYPGGQKALWASTTSQPKTPPNLVKNLGPYSLAVAGGAGGDAGGDFDIVTDSAKTIYAVPKTAKGSATTAVSAVQLLVGILAFLLL